MNTTANLSTAAKFVRPWENDSGVTSNSCKVSSYNNKATHNDAPTLYYPKPIYCLTPTHHILSSYMRTKLIPQSSSYNNYPSTLSNMTIPNNLNDSGYFSSNNIISETTPATKLKVSEISPPYMYNTLIINVFRLVLYIQKT